MKNWLSILIPALLFSFMHPVVEKSEIQFIGSWTEALKIAKEKKKPVFLDTYTSWCGPCKKMQTHTFRNKEAADFFNDQFVNVSVDLEKGEGPGLASAFNIAEIPTLIIADPDGNIISYTKGYLTPSQLIEFGKYAVNKYNINLKMR